MLSFEEQFKVYIGSGFPLIISDTIEVDRATDNLMRITQQITEKLPETNAKPWLKQSGLRFNVWNTVDGWTDPLNPQEDGKPGKVGGSGDTGNVRNALNFILKKETPPGVYIMQNFHLHWMESLAHNIQLLRNIYFDGKKTHKHLVLVGSMELPPEIATYFVNVEFVLPNKKTLNKAIVSYTKALGMELKDKNITDATNAVLGMTTIEVESAVCVSAVKHKGKLLDVELLYQEKAKAVKKTGLLEYIETDYSIDDIGGLPNLKASFPKTAKAFNNREEAEKYSLPFPKGVMLIGMSGCGKSLSAKAIAKILGTPLYRCDLGRLFGGIVGTTEANTRNLFKIIDSISPATIWLDEIDKMMSGLDSSGSSDAGVTAKVIGAFLSYLADKNNLSYFVATANQVTKLPPELLGKHRWDEMWFIDLPSDKERDEIFKIHIKRVNRDPKKFKIKELVEHSGGLTGAEIASVVKIAMFDGFFNDGKKSTREFTTKDMLKALKETVPLIQTKKEEIEAMQKWAETRAKWANPKTKLKSMKVKGKSAEEGAFWSTEEGSA